MTRQTKIWIGAAISFLLLAALIVFYLFDPQEQEIFPKCTFKAVTGYDCPGCGSQRAIHDMLHLNLARALSHNALMFLLIPYILFGVFMEFFGGKTRFPKLERIFFGKWAAIMVLLTIVSFWVLRNL